MDNSDCIYKDMNVCEGECPSTCIQWVVMKYLLKHSNIPKAQQCVHKLRPNDCDLQAFERLSAIQMDIVNFTYNGGILYIYSRNCGNGKTTWSIKMLLQFFHEIWEGNGLTERGLFINVPTFLVQLKNAISKPSDYLDEIKQLLPEVDLVVFDDISNITASNYDYSNLYTYIESRCFQNKAMIFTGNVPPEELSNVLGNRIVSRICQGVNIELKGADRRQWCKNNY